MKNKIATIILGIALVLSVGGNIYLVKTMTDAKEEVTSLDSQLVTANNQIADLQEQLTNLTVLQAQVDDLQGQLTENKEQIENLESTIAENNTTIVDLEEQLANQEQLLLEAQEQAQAQTAGNQSRNSASTSGSNTPNDTPTDHTYDNQQGTSGGSSSQLVDGHPQIGHSYNDDPNFPIYEGEKEGYGWSNAWGYLPSNGGTGTVQTGDDMPGGHDPCVYDENGNCTIHKHNGF